MATSVALVTGLGLFAASAHAQIPTTVPPGAPPPSQAAAALQQAVEQNPGVADAIRQRIGASGLSAEQIHARLQSLGYPSNLLDAYMRPTRASGTPTPQEVAAVQALGLPAISIDVGNIPLDTGLVGAVEGSEVPGHIFGVDVFKRSTTQFLPLLSGPVPADYRLGPGDHLVLILTGDVENAYDLSVTREGFALIPQVGQLYVANLTLGQLRDVLYTRLGRVYSGIRRGPGATAHFDITVASLGAIQVYVVGEVTQPGAYQLSSLGTVLSGLYAAGGVTERATTRRIDVRRSGQVIASFDLYDYLLHGDIRNDIRLQTGDVIFVGVHGTRAEVRGAVRRAGIYELRDHESLADLIAAAGGFRADAALQRISITRTLPPPLRTAEGPQKVVVDVPLRRESDGRVTVPPFPVEDGDEVNVDALPYAVRGYVDILGNVYQPGRFAYVPGMKLSQLVRVAGGFAPATYAGRAHIERLDPSDQTRSVLPVELPRDSAGVWPSDPVLQDHDVVTIYGRPEMRQGISVAITGMVNSPGSYPWREGMTLRDLMLMARGPQIGADLREAEIARLPADRSQGQMAATFRVPLDSTYLFDRDSSGRYIGPPGIAFPPSGTPEVPIKPFDNVLILRQPGFELQRTVAVMGEVRYPGTYALRNSGDRLVDLIERAGGLSPRAYPQGVRFVRAVGVVGRVNIDLPRALRDHGARDNVTLQPGDSIYVPEFQPSVRVAGAVNSPGSVLHVPGKGLGYYIDAAGGTTRLAIGGRASVRQPNGRVETRGRFLFWSRDPVPQAGAEVYVPARDPSDKPEWPGMVTNIVQILSSLVATALIVSRF